MIPIQLLSPDGSATDTIIRIGGLPSGPAVLETRIRDFETAAIRESTEYRFQLDCPGDVERVEPTEIFHADHADWKTGRVRTGLKVGVVPVAVVFTNGVKHHGWLEVRSTKLDFDSHYRWMLDDIADIATEALLQSFAASELPLTTAAGSSETLYHRFVILHAALNSQSLQRALEQITRAPYESYEDLLEEVDTRGGFRGGTAAYSKLVGGPSRVATPFMSVSSVPLRMDRRRAHPTIDNLPNRFVAFALRHWLNLSYLLLEQLGDDASVRALDNINTVIQTLESLLAQPLFNDVGQMSVFPGVNQVLQKRSGYREVLRSYFKIELASGINWKGADDFAFAGQRDIAALYEYWVYLQVVSLFGDLLNTDIDLRQLFRVSSDGIQLNLKQGRNVVVTGSMERLGRRLSVSAWYNRTFTKSEVWTQQMRPDLSVEIAPAPGVEDFQPVWIHLDAKYRVDALNDLFDVSSDNNGIVDVKRDDLLKMHAYRDAIRRTAGSYVVYPGTQNLRFSEYNELLPGLGAFRLRPSDSGVADGRATVRQFFDEVLTHIATQASQHERARFWFREAYERSSPPSSPANAEPVLAHPPADVRVLLGYVKNYAHFEWVKRHRLYNVRADLRDGAVSLGAKELSSSFLLVYGASLDEPVLYRIVEKPLIQTAEQLEKLNYPRTRGELYFCIRLGETNEMPRIPSRAHIENLRRRRNTVSAGPAAVTWSALFNTRDNL